MAEQVVGNLDLTRQLQRLLDVRGSLQLSLAGDILPVVNAFNLDDPPFHSKRGLFVTLTVAAVAARYSRLRVAHNGAADSTIVFRYIDLWRYGAEAAVGGWFNSTTADLGAVVGTNAQGWDSGRRSDEARLTWTDDAAILPYQWQVNAPANTIARVPGPLVLRPGSSLDLQQQIAGVDLRVTLYADIYENS